MYESILVPTDGSEGTEGAIAHAIDLATRYDAALHTVYVVETSNGSLGLRESDIFEGFQEVGEEAIQAVIDRAEEADVSTVEGTIARGAPARAILDYVDQHDVDMVVMGTHGRTGLERYLLGSVTERVVRTSPVPVMTVPLSA